MRRSVVLLRSLLAAACFAASCKSEEPSESQQHAVGAALYARCDDDSDCESGMCTFGLYTLQEHGVCTMACDSDSSCTREHDDATCAQVPIIPELEADHDALETREVCLLPCTESEQDIYACADGVRAFCGLASASCEACGCPDGSYCDPDDDRCASYLHRGNSCDEDRQCLSGHCVDGECTSGPGDPCDDSCDGTCGGPPDDFYCMPTCEDGRCPVQLHNWSCLSEKDAPERQFCGRVCSEADDCLSAGDVCEQLPQAHDDDWVRPFTGFCRQAP